VNDLDPAIVERACGGDDHAFRIIVETYQRAIYRIAYRYSLDQEGAFDLAQEIFLHVHRMLDRYDSSRPFEPWFFRVATNFSINWIRKKRPQEVSLDAFEADITPAVDESSPGEQVEREEEAALIREAVAGLPEPYREIVVLRYLEGITLEEVGGILELPEGTVKNRLFRARELLRQRLTGTGFSKEMTENQKKSATGETPPPPER
jgi:RNA polymerase sigma-70 factor (ECF subfamily)